ncbi:unnamed protein product [Mytilus edulis]|uniref:CCHC-type domain-containing protein n=1 Tax=Mytilus edulis TaxID=6550 RepID=A0A8S3RFD7_MYTED|nr:unnamed protein product [Mytilus edulis]
MSDINRTQQNANSAGIDHKRKKFVLRWICLILKFDTCDRMVFCYISCEVIHILNSYQIISHIRDNAKNVLIDSLSPLQVKRSKFRVKISFSGSNDNVLAGFLCYSENIFTLNAWSEERKKLVFFHTLQGQSEEFCMFIRRTKPKTLQEAVSSAMQEECIRINEGNVNKDNWKSNVYTVGKESDVYEPSSKKNNYSESPINNRRYQNKIYRQCTNCGKRGHTREYCRSKTHSNNQNISIQTVPEEDIVQKSGGPSNS